jgi:hypothetical protein
MRTLWAVIAFCALFGAFSLRPADAATWHKAETASFRVYSSGSKRDLRKLAITLEDFDALLRIITGLNGDPPPDKFDLYLVKKSKDLRRYTALADTVGGYYSATPTGTAAFSARSSIRAGKTSRQWAFSSQQVLFHEYAHHFMLRYFPFSYPRWYSEGFAEYVSTARFTKKYIEFGDFSLGRVATLQRFKWLPILDLMAPVPGPLNETETQVFYAQSWLLTHYLMRSPKRSVQLPEYIKLTPGPEDLEDAILAAFGVDSAALAKEVKDYFGGKGEQVTLTRYNRKAAVDIPVKITQLPDSAEDVLLISAKLNLGIDRPFHQPLLSDVEAIKKQYPDDRDAARIWAHAQTLYGDLMAGRSALVALVEADPQDALCHYLLGMSFMREAYGGEGKQADIFDIMAKARRHFTRAFKLDNAHYPTLYHYYLTLPQPTSEANERVLEEAEFLAPQVAEIRYTLADMWADRDSEQHRLAAIRLLRLLASNPHGGVVASLASTRLRSLIGE